MSCVVSETICLKCTQVCNKCGLFERAHGVPRPATFLRRRRWRPTPAYQNMGHPFDHAEYSHHDDRLSVQPFASHFPDAFGSTGGETSSQGMTWVNHGVFPTPSGLSPSCVSLPQPTSTIIYCTCPAEAASLPYRLGVFRLSPSVASVPVSDAINPFSSFISILLIVSLSLMIMVGFANKL
jgi:hypothetical protein